MKTWKLPRLCLGFCLLGLTGCVVEEYPWPPLPPPGYTGPRRAPPPEREHGQVREPSRSAGRGDDSSAWQSQNQRSKVAPSSDSGSAWGTSKAAPSKSKTKAKPREGWPLEGDASEPFAGNQTYRNRHTGEITGSAYTSPAGTTTYRDSSGLITGSSSESPAGTTTYRNSSGEITATSSSTTDSGGGITTTYRRNGLIVGNKYVSPAGNVTWRDGNGSIISGPSQMK